MRVAVTGATGFLGRYIVAALVGQGHTCRCWYRPTSDRSGFDTPDERLEWIPGALGDRDSAAELVAGCDAVVHAALYRAGSAFRGGEGDVVSFVRTNVLGSIELIEEARAADIPRLVFIATCAVHEHILDDRPLDETHPLWPTTHYGAHKAAMEKFVHSYGFGLGYPICSLRPSGIYGIARPLEQTKWFDLVRRVMAGETVECRRGGKEVHAADVARAVQLLLEADAATITGQAYSCCDSYVSEYEVAMLARQFSKSDAKIVGAKTQPKHEIVTDKIESLGMKFRRRPLLGGTIRDLVTAIQNR